MGQGCQWFGGETLTLIVQLSPSLSKTFFYICAAQTILNEFTPETATQ